MSSSLARSPGPANLGNNKAGSAVTFRSAKGVSQASPGRSWTRRPVGAVALPPSRSSVTLTLTGANSYSGGTTINAGTLEVSQNTFGTGAVTINNGGTLKTSGEWAFGGANGYGVVSNLIPSVTIETGGTLDFGSGGSANGISNLYLNGGTVTGGGGFEALFGALFLFDGNEKITAGGATTSTIAARSVWMGTTTRSRSTPAAR